MWLLIVGIAVPMMCFILMGVRCIFFYFAARDAAYQASIQSSFTAAKATAATTLTRDSNSWNGITLSGAPKVVVVVQSNSANSSHELPGPLAAGSVNTNSDVYMIKVYSTAIVQPILSTGGAAYIQMVNIPGLTTGIPLTIGYQVYFEQPAGLEN